MLCVHLQLNISIFFIAVKQIVSRRVARVWRHEVGKLESDYLFGDFGGSFELETQVTPIRGREFDRHIPVE